MRRHLQSESIALRSAELEAITTDGHRTRLNGNMEFPEEIPSLLKHGAEGIGLYRTEFLFLNRALPPTEEEHYRAYREVLEAMGNRQVTIRTLDLGGDKVPGKKPEKESNPRDGSARDSLLPAAPRDVSGAAAGAVARIGAREFAGDVPPHLGVV